MKKNKRVILLCSTDCWVTWASPQLSRIPCVSEEQGSPFQGPTRLMNWSRLSKDVRGPHILWVCVRGGHPHSLEVMVIHVL